MQMKTYSRKSMSRSSAQFDALISSATSSTKTAVSVSRWGQTTFTSVRRQNESENNSNNNNNNNNNNSNNNSNNDRIFQDSKRPKIEKFDNLREKSIETKTLIKPKVNKFFKSKNIANALFDDIVKEKIIRDKEENRFLTINNTCNEKKEIEVKPKSWKPLNESQTKKSERKSREINCKKLDDEKYNSGNDINKNDKKTNSKNNNNNNSVKKNISQNSVPIRGTRSSRRLQGAAPEVVQEVNKLKCFNTLETENNQILSINQPIVDSCLSDITTNSVSININQNQLMIDNNSVKDEICSLRTDSNSDNMELDLNNDLTQTISDSKSSSQSSDNDFKFVEPKSLSQPIPELSHENFNDDKQIPISNSQPESTSSSSSQVIVTKPKKKIFSSSKKNRAVFNMKNFWSSDSKEFSDELQASDQSIASSSSVSNDNKKSVNDFDFDDDSNYIKLHRVKKAHQCHDLGETEQFDDDIKYHLSGIESSNTIPMRCLRYLSFYTLFHKLLKRISKIIELFCDRQYIRSNATGNETRISDAFESTRRYAANNQCLNGCTD